MEDYKLLETLTDLAFAAGSSGYYSGDSRSDMESIIWLAKEFQQVHQSTDWHEQDYISTVDAFAEQHLRTAILRS